jgi:flagellar motility protein MotE (MotC chaperone)
MLKSALFLFVTASLIPVVLVLLYTKGMIGVPPQGQPSQVVGAPDSLRLAAVADSIARAEQAREDSIFRAQEQARIEYEMKEEEKIRLTSLRLELEQKRQELDALKEDLSSLLQQTKASPDSHIVRLVKLYEAMKPQKAAIIMEAMSDSMIVEILPRMKDRQAAKILSAIKPPDRGAKLTRMMTEISY